MKSADIWLALQGFLEAWQLSSRLVCERSPWNVKSHSIVHNVWSCGLGTTTLSTDLLHVKQHKQFDDLNGRKQRSKQHSEPVHEQGPHTPDEFAHLHWAIYSEFQQCTESLLGKYQVRVCPYMSSSTLWAMSNTGFLLLCSTCSLKRLDERQTVCSVNQFGRKITVDSNWETLQLASTGTPPEKCKEQWKKNPSAAGGTVLALQCSPNTEKRHNHAWES